MEIGKGADNICRERETETPRKRSFNVMDVLSQIAVLDEFRYDEDAAVRIRGA
jgi:hypothetical protein